MRSTRVHYIIGNSTFYGVLLPVERILPAAAPMLLLFSTVNRKRGRQGTPAVPTGIFLLGYLLVWGGFSLLATLAQGGLHTLMLLSPGMAIANPHVSGLILLAAGAYQFTPLKKVCLIRCQSPLDFLLTHALTRRPLRQKGKHGLG